MHTVDVDRESLAGQLRVQAGHCRSLGSPLYEDLLLRAADDVVGGGPVWRLFEGRATALLGGFLEVARAHPGLPLRLAEIGASAGLNLRWDRYRYEGRGWSWGEPGSPVVFPSVFEGAAAPPADARVTVAERLGCD